MKTLTLLSAREYATIVFDDSDTEEMQAFLAFVSARHEARSATIEHWRDIVDEFNSCYQGTWLMFDDFVIESTRERYDIDTDLDRYINWDLMVDEWMQYYDAIITDSGFYAIFSN